MLFVILNTVVIILIFSLIKMLISGLIVPFFFACLIFGISLNTFALALSTVFSDSKLATQIGTLSVLIMIMVFMPVSIESILAVECLYFIPVFPLVTILIPCI